MNVSRVLVTALIALMQTSAPPRSIDKSARSDITSPRQVVIRTQGEWDALWREHMPSRQREAIDFSKEMVVGVFLGSRPTAGYGVAIESAVEADGVLHVRYRETSPARDAMTAQVITFPYHLVAIPKSAATDVTLDKVR